MTTRRTIAAGGLLVVLLAVSAYLWTREAAGIDRAVVQTREAYTCPHCGHHFELTVEQATRMLQAGDGIVCPRCGRSGSTKAKIEWQIGAFGPDGGEGETGSPEIPEDRPPAPTGGLTPKGDSNTG